MGISVPGSVAFIQMLKKLWQGRLLWERSSVGRPDGGSCSQIAGGLLQEGTVSYCSPFIASFVVFPCVYACSHAASLPFCAKIALGSG